MRDQHRHRIPGQHRLRPARQRRRADRRSASARTRTAASASPPARRRERRRSAWRTARRGPIASATCTHNAGSAASSTRPGNLPATTRKTRNSEAMTTKLKAAVPSAIIGRQMRGNVAFFIRLPLATNTACSRDQRLGEERPRQQAGAQEDAVAERRIDAGQAASHQVGEHQRVDQDHRHRPDQHPRGPQQRAAILRGDVAPDAALHEAAVVPDVA